VPASRSRRPTADAKGQVLNLDRRSWPGPTVRPEAVDEIPGVGPALALFGASVVSEGLGQVEFSAWPRARPKQHSSGGKDKLGRNQQTGDRYLRLFTAGARAVPPAKIYGT